jgi:hypothetical protein
MYLNDRWQPPVFLLLEKKWATFFFAAEGGKSFFLGANKGPARRATRGAGKRLQRGYKAHTTGGAYSAI